MHWGLNDASPLETLGDRDCYSQGKGLLGSGSIVRLIILGLMLGLILGLITACGVSSQFCQTISEHQVCVATITLSAKNYWEYRAVLQIDGVKQLPEVFDCRHQVRISQGGAIVPFQAQGIGEWICEIFDS
jgi:hypothetical protein